MNDFEKVAVFETVVELFVDVSQVSDVKLALSVSVEKNEMSLSTFFGEWVTLNDKIKVTIFLVSSVINPSKSRAWVWLASSISTRAL